MLFNFFNMTKIVFFCLGIHQSSKSHGSESYRKALAVFVFAAISVLTSSAQTPLNETDVYNRIMGRQHVEGYTEGSPWDNSHIYVNTVEFDGYAPGRYTARGCSAFMMDMMEYASNYEYPIRKVYGSYDHLPEIHIGDRVRVNNNGHSVVVIGKSDDGHTVTVVEGNYNSSVHWNRTIDLANPKNGFSYIATFWPENLYDKGDVNHDGTLNITDVVLMVDFILGNTPSNFYSENADFNEDGGINITDVVKLIDAILGNKPQSNLTCPDENHPHQIDLGLPSGTKWACCNVGSTNPEKCGGYYAWGETEEKDCYSWETYVLCDGSASTCRDLGDICGTQYDVAHVKWGEKWQMPSLEQLKELLENCTIEWVKDGDDVEGMKFISSINGACLFLPASGYRHDTEFNYRDGCGLYWMGTHVAPYDFYAYCLLIESGIYIDQECHAGWYDFWDDNVRCNGYNVRPVWGVE